MNVFLGLGLPWVIASTWESNTPEQGEGGIGGKGYSTDTYFVPARTLGFSVLVFIITACIAILVLIVRRRVVGGELGGSQTGRTLSAAGLTSLWFIYIIMSIFQSINLGGIGEKGWGIDITKVNPNTKCNLSSSKK